MKLLLWHAKEFNLEVTGLSNRPKGIKPESLTDKTKKTHKTDSIVAFITVEPNDNSECAQLVLEEIAKFCIDTDNKIVVILPFAHLSNELATSRKAIPILEKIEELCKENGFLTKREHFGSDKSILLNVHGHKGNVRFRSL